MDNGEESEADLDADDGEGEELNDDDSSPSSSVEQLIGGEMVEGVEDDEEGEINEPVVLPRL